jgi:hypothetical protein
MFRAFIVAAFGALSASQAVVKDCGAGSSLFTIKNLDFSPSLPVPGQNGTLHSIYEVPTEITSGTSRYSCTLNGIPVYDEKVDLCTQTACPIVMGTHDDYSISQVPDTTGKVSCKIDWRSPAGNQLMCIQMVLTLSKSSSSSSSSALRGTLNRTTTQGFYGYQLIPYNTQIGALNTTFRNDYETYESSIPTCAAYPFSSDYDDVPTSESRALVVF